MNKLIPKPQRKPKNGPEGHFYDYAKSKGWEATKRGWPDFFCTLPDGSLALVEVKPKPTSLLKRSQWDVMQKLSKLGIKCFRYDPIGGLKELDLEKDKR